MTKITEYNKSSIYDLISMGAGTGKKDYFILKNLLQDMEDDNLRDDDVLHYFSLDLSMSMIREAIYPVSSLLSRFSNLLRILPITVDFTRIDNLQFIFKESKNPRIITLLGNTIGNLPEYTIMKNIYSFIRDNDFVVLDVESHNDRSESDLTSFYQQDEWRTFVCGPLEDMTHINVSNDNFKVKLEGDISDIPNSRTVVGYAEFDDRKIRVFYSTKYNILHT